MTTSRYDIACFAATLNAITSDLKDYNPVFAWFTPVPPSREMVCLLHCILSRCFHRELFANYVRGNNSKFPTEGFTAAAGKDLTWSSVSSSIIVFFSCVKTINFPEHRKFQEMDYCIR